MIIVCSNCGQNMEGTRDLLQSEVKCPSCMKWVRPQLPQADGSIRPERAGQTRLNQLANAAQQVAACNDKAADQPERPPRPNQDGWYVLTASGRRGPFSNDTIMQFARTGKINAASRLKNVANGTELRAGDIPNLFGATPAKRPHSPIAADKPNDGWYVRTSKGEVGPFANAQIVSLAKAGRISTKTMMRFGRDGQFVAAGTVRGLIPANA